MMLRKIRSYLVFSTRLYKIAVFLILPVLMVAMTIFTSGIYHAQGSYFVTIFMILVEIVADNWAFGGIQSKTADKLDYLKSSVHGEEIILNGIEIDLARRAVWTIVNFGVCNVINAFTVPDYLANYNGIEKICVMVLPVLIVLAISNVGIFITRFFAILWVNLIVGYAGFLIGAIGYFVCSINLYAASLILLVGSVLIMIPMVMVVKQKVRRSYYDEKC